MKITQVTGMMTAIIVAIVSAVAIQKRVDGVEYTAVKAGDTFLYGEAVRSDPNLDTLALLTRMLRPNQMALSAEIVSCPTSYAQWGTIAAMVNITVVGSAAGVVRLKLAAKKTMGLSLANATE